MDNNDFSIKLQALSFKKTVLFGTCCIERIIELYKYFEDELLTENDENLLVFKNGYGSLKNLLEEIYKIIISEKYDQDFDYTVFEEKCLEFVPDTEEISSYNAVLAQNCAIGLSYVFKYLSDKNVQNIMYCSDKVIESIDVIGFSQNISEELIDEKTEHEIIVQIEYIQRIERLDEPFTIHDIETIKTINKINRVDFKDIT